MSSCGFSRGLFFLDEAAQGNPGGFVDVCFDLM
jgi:hypothetical protein